MPAEYYLLKRAIAAGARPRAILADFFPLMLADQPPRVDPGLPRAGPPWPTPFDLAWTVQGRRPPRIDPGSASSCRRSGAASRIRANLTALAPGGAGVHPDSGRIGGVWDRLEGGVGRSARCRVGPPPARSRTQRSSPGLFPVGWDLRPDQRHLLRAVSWTSPMPSRSPSSGSCPPSVPRSAPGGWPGGWIVAYARFAQAAQGRHPALVVLGRSGDWLRRVGLLRTRFHLKRRRSPAPQRRCRPGPWRPPGGAVLGSLGEPAPLMPGGSSRDQIPPGPLTKADRGHLDEPFE